MIPIKRHQVEAPDVVQFIGLMMLIGFIYRQFGPGFHPHVTPSVLAVFAAGVFFLVWPMSLKSRQ